jgi:hypothetical protein
MPAVSSGNCQESDVTQELHRLRESQMLLLLKAEALGLAVPRSCCTHPGETACLACTLDWLVAYAAPARKALQCTGRSAHHV